MRFWDSSAVLPLLFREGASDDMATLLQSDSAMAVWYWTAVECTSAIERRRREGASSVDLAVAKKRLAALESAWFEVTEFSLVRIRAERCLRLHPLRAADSGQLAAALVFTERVRTVIPFVTLDVRLALAAEKEGFDVVGLS